MQWFWTAVMRPKITYAAFIWAKAAENKTVQAKLRSVQRFALMMIASVRKGSPTRTLEIIYNVVPLHLHIRYIAISTLIRIDARVTWLTHLKTKGHIAYATKELPSSLQTRVMDKAPFKRDWCINYEVIIDDGILPDWKPDDSD